MNERAKWWIAAILFGAMVNALVIGGAKALAVHAAPSQPDACEVVGVISSITVWQCEDLDGQPFLVNNVGFMAVVE